MSEIVEIENRMREINDELSRLSTRRYALTKTEDLKKAKALVGKYFYDEHEQRYFATKYLASHSHHTPSRLSDRYGGVVVSLDQERGEVWIYTIESVGINGIEISEEKFMSAYRTASDIIAKRLSSDPVK